MVQVSTHSACLVPPTLEHHSSCHYSSVRHLPPSSTISSAHNLALVTSPPRAPFLVRLSECSSHSPFGAPFLVPLL
eukprot:355955-Chlamydomonas_euryale.AAC.10